MWRELQRRNVVKVGAAYAVVGWLIVQIAATFFPALQMPEWTVTLVASFIILGFPLALVLAWAYELTPDGIARAASDKRDGEPIGGVARPINLAIICGLVVVLGFVIYDFASEEETAQDSALVADVLPNSIAVLPFDNLSPDPNNAYFAAGIHEATLNQLANVNDLSVIARTSVLQYADNPPPIPEIARELRVETVLEGSVRYDNDRVLITAQLIDGRTGAHLWSEEFNRNLSDIFAIQAEIAAQIARRLQADISPEEEARIRRAATESDAAYALYLRSLEPNEADVVIGYLDRAVDIDADFALAHAMKARVLAYDYPGEVARAVAIDPESAPLVALELERLVVTTAERALELDPELGLAHAALGVMHMRAWRSQEAEAAFARALALTPHDTEVLRWASYFESLAGNSGAAINLMQRAVEIDPENSFFDLAEAYFFAREFDAAAAIHQQLLSDDDPDSGSYRFYAEVETARGLCGAALDNFGIAEQLGLGGGVGPRVRVAYAYSRCDRPADANRILATIADADTAPSLIQQAVGQLAAGHDAEALRLFNAAADSELRRSCISVRGARDHVDAVPGQRIPPASCCGCSYA
ncbi:MAG TPA: hypothetical protein VIV14_06150, partial [Gammaproteobacteria bacterium]